MTATVNASTSAGVIVTSDTSGALALQTAGTTALTISSSQVVTVANDATIHGLTVGQGAGSVSTNTAVGASALGEQGIANFEANVQGQINSLENPPVSPTTQPLPWTA